MTQGEKLVRRRWFMGVAGLAALGAGGWMAWQQRGDARSNDEALQAFWALKLPQPDGSMLTLSTLQGRPLLVNFWATWCPPCVRELPMISRFAETQQAAGAQGIQVLGLAVDQAPAVQKWLARQPLAFPVALTGAGGVTLTRGLGNINGGLPFTLLLDAQGDIRQRKIGELSLQDLQQWSA